MSTINIMYASPFLGLKRFWGIAVVTIEDLAFGAVL
jgi:hypothetical protein